MLAEFSLRLVFGMSLVWALMPRNDVTVGFFRIQMLLALGLLVLAAVTAGRFIDPEAATHLSTKTTAILASVTAGAAYFGSAVWTLGHRRVGAVAVYAILFATGLNLVGSFSPTTGWTTSEGVLHNASHLATAGTLGASMCGMLLGHWYLTAPTMSTAPLNRVNLMLGAAAVLRLAVSAGALALIWPVSLNSNQLIWIALRWVCGIVGPLAVAVMVWRILKYKNTQAATGVLFVAVILTFIGEMTAALVSRDLGVPI